MSNKIFSREEAFNKSLDYFNGDELAASVFLDKYALRDNEGNLLEDTPEKMHRRLAKEFARIEKNKFKKPLTEQEIFSLFDRFKYIVPQGSPMSAIGNEYQLQSLGNCFTVPTTHDSYGGILYTDQQLVQLMKRRAGVGCCIDDIRPKGLLTKNAAKTTDGIAVFMERFSNSCREVAQGGRRGALLIALSIHHPEIETFINIKRDLKKVTGANISIKITDDFMRAVKNDEDYEQKWPINSKNPVIKKNVKARDIWNQIIEANWLSAEPGILYIDTIKNKGLSDCYKIKDSRFEDVTTNPCQPKWASVLTRNGLSTIGEINVGDEIWSETGWTKVINKWSTGIKPIYKWITDGYSEYLCEYSHFVGTENHRVISNGKKIEISETETIDFFNDDSPNGATLEPICLMNCNITDVQYIGDEEVFDITVDNNTHTYWTGGVNVSNCGEIPMGVDSCRLMLINLWGYIENQFTKEAKFNYNKFYNDCKIAQRLMDDMIDLEIEAIDKIIDKVNNDPEPEYIKQIELDTWKNFKETCLLGRRTGLGITALGDIIAALGEKYGNDESIKITEKIYKTLAVASFESSCDMAKELGAFKLWDYNVEKDNILLNKLLNELGNIESYKQYGRRNVSLTTTAPAGSVSICTQTTSGIEPVYLLQYTRRKKINPDNKNIKIDFIDNLGDQWEEFTVNHHKLNEWMEITGNSKIENSPYFGATSNEIDWIKSVEIQSVAQSWISHSISKTCNVPSSVSKELVSDIYIKAWESGCKGFTIYRDGSRDGVLINKESSKESLKEDCGCNKKIKKTTAPKRPKELPCEVHHVTYKGGRYYVIVGIFDGDVYEVFSAQNTDSEGDIIVPKSIKEGKLIKKGRGKYVLVNEEKEYSSIITNGHSDDTVDVITRILSCSLRHGTSIAFLIHQLEKTKGDMTSFAKVLARTLKKYIADGTEISGEVCPECGSKLIRQSGCVQCSSCSWAKCQ